MENYENKVDAVHVIEEKIPEIKAVIQSVMEDRQQIQPFTVELTPTEFPAKIYGNQLYKAGIYDALKIVLGEGEGANWWCVLFPPLCFLDFGTASVEEPAVAEDSEKNLTDATEAKEVKVEFFLLKWFQDQAK